MNKFIKCDLCNNKIGEDDLYFCECEICLKYDNPVFICEDCFNKSIDYSVKNNLDRVTIQGHNYYISGTSDEDD